MKPPRLPVTRAFAALLIVGSAGVGLIVAAEVHVLRAHGVAHHPATAPTTTAATGPTNPWQNAGRAATTWLAPSAPAVTHAPRRHATPRATTRAYVATPTATRPRTVPAATSSTSASAPATSSTVPNPAGSGKAGNDGRLAGLP